MNPVKTSPDTLPPLNFYQTCLELLTPCTSLLADSGRLSISQVRQALPVMVKAVIYQSLTFIQTHGQAKFISDILQAPSLAPLAFREKAGLTFRQLATLQAEFMPFRQRLFAENSDGRKENFTWLAGLLVQRTGLTVAQTIDLFDKVALLTLKLLVDIRILATTSASQNAIKQPLTDKAFFNWLNLQPMLMASLDDTGLIDVLGYHSDTTLGQSLKDQATFYKNNSSNPEFTTLASLISHYKNTQPLGIIPNELVAKPKRLVSPIALTPDTPSIFIAEPPLTAKKPTWQQTLQRHWMLTAGVLTGLVFGGIALFSPTKDKPKSQLTHQQIEAMPHDVAIIKVDSSSEITDNSVKSAVSSVSLTKTASSTSKTEAKSAHTKDNSKDKENSKDKPKDKPKSDKKDDTKKTTQAEKSKSVSKSDKTKTATKDTKKSTDRPKDKPKTDTMKKSTTEKNHN